MLWPGQDPLVECVPSQSPQKFGSSVAPPASRCPQPHSLPRPSPLPPCPALASAAERKLPSHPRGEPLTAQGSGVQRFPRAEHVGGREEGKPRGLG